MSYRERSHDCFEKTKDLMIDGKSSIPLYSRECCAFKNVVFYLQSIRGPRKVNLKVLKMAHFPIDLLDSV